MPKMMLPATHTSCLKDTHTYFQINVGIGISYFLGILQFVCKSQCWKYQIYLFKIWSYKFLFLRRNWYKILLALTHVCMPKMMLPAIQTSCLKDSHTHLEKYVGLGTRYFGDSFSSYVKNDAASNCKQLFKIYSYKFLNQHRNWYMIN